jgi:uncharacterized protein (DUF488 family)
MMTALHTVSVPLKGYREIMALFYTIGHSTRSLAELVEILEIEEIGLVVDVRAFARSRTNPQFNLDTLPRALAEHAIDYLHMAELGGRRGRQRIGVSPNTFWQNQSFRNYADYAMTEAFQEGLARLRMLGEATPCAVMCSEALWWRCHRRIIADYLVFAGETVVHVFARGKKEVARLTPAARRAEDGKIIYAAGNDST